MTMSERWLIGGIAAVLGAIFSFLVNQVLINTSRLATLENQVLTLERTHLDLKGEIRDHRAFTETRKAP